jgi:hypothetical protein
MFGKKKKKEENKEKDDLNFKTENYIMKDHYNSNSLVVANLESVTNETEIPMVETTDQRYIFEIIDDNGKLRFREIFTGFKADRQSNFGYFNLPYVVDVVPLKEVVPTIRDEIPKLGLLLLLNEVNKKEEEEEKAENEVCVIFKDEEEEKRFSQIASDLNHKTKEKTRKTTIQ